MSDRRFVFPEQDHFELLGHDNGSHYFENTEVAACPTCGLVDDIEWVNPVFRVKRRKLDFSSTYDGATLASRRFVDFVSDWPGARFKELPSDPDFCLVAVTRSVPLDPERANMRATDPCPTCRRFTQVTCSFGACLAEGAVVPDGLSRTDAVYGSASTVLGSAGPPRKCSQWPGLLTTEARVDQLAAQQFRGLLVLQATCQE